MSTIAPFDASIAFTYGTVVEAAYRLFAPGVLDPSPAGATLPAGWTIRSEITAIDKVGRKTEREFFGLAVDAGEGTLVIAIRGTDTILEWVVDAEFLPRAFTSVPGAGKVEDGFNEVYATLHCTTGDCDVLSLVRQAAPGTKVIVAGHSLGAAVATLLAIDIAAALPALDLTLYTYASPKVGDKTFAALCDAKLKHFRIENEPDLVPKVPALYHPTGTLIQVDSKSFPNIAHKIACYHTLTTYLYLLNQSSPAGLGSCARATS